MGKILQVMEAECICIRGKREEREGRSEGMSVGSLLGFALEVALEDLRLPL